MIELDLKGHMFEFFGSQFESGLGQVDTVIVADFRASNEPGIDLTVEIE